jgi:hypothetical protein
MDTPTSIISVELADGTVIKVAATLIGDQQVATPSFPFKAATDAIKAVAKELAEVLQEVKPDKATVKFGLEIAVESGQLTTLVVKGASKGNLEITLEWGK